MPEWTALGPDLDRAAPLVVATVLAAFSGLCLARRTPADWSSADRLLTWGVATLGMTIISLQALGLLALFHMWPVLLTHGALACFAWTWARGAAPLIPSGAGRNLWAAVGRSPLALATLILTMVELGVMLAAASQGAYRGDALTRLLPLSVEWLQDGRIDAVFAQAPSYYYPSNGSLVFLWSMLPLRELTLVGISAWFITALAALAIYALGRKAGAGVGPALLGTAVFLSANEVLRVTSIGYVDMVSAAPALCAVNYVLIPSRSEGTTTTVSWALLAGLCGGIAVGSKYGAVAYVAFSLAVMLAVRARAWRAYWPSALRELAVFLVAAILAGGYWYWRNFWLVGNPVYPGQVVVLGRVLFDGPWTQQYLRSTSLLSWIPVAVTTPEAWQRYISALLSYTGYAIPAAAIAGLLTVAAGWAIRPARRYLLTREALTAPSAYAQFSLLLLGAAGVITFVTSPFCGAHVANTAIVWGGKPRFILANLGAFCALAAVPAGRWRGLWLTVLAVTCFTAWQAYRGLIAEGIIYGGGLAAVAAVGLLARQSMSRPAGAAISGAVACVGLALVLGPLEKTQPLADRTAKSPTGHVAVYQWARQLEEPARLGVADQPILPLYGRRLANHLTGVRAVRSEEDVEELRRTLDYLVIVGRYRPSHRTEALRAALAKRPESFRPVLHKGQSWVYKVRRAEANPGAKAAEG